MLAALGLLLAWTGTSRAESGTCPGSDQTRPRIMIVGAYHFVSKANVHNLPVDDPTTPRRQGEILEVVRRLAAFRPTKVVLEETSGTSDLERAYREYIAGRRPLEPSENHQIGFRTAQAAGLDRIFLTDARTPFDYDAVADYARQHGQEGLIRASDRALAVIGERSAELLRTGTVLDLFRYYNEESTIRRANSSYMFITRVGQDHDFVGARLVADWHLRNLEMFAQLTRIADGECDRVLMLYGFGHAYLLRQFVADSPDLELVDPLTYLR